MHIHSHGIEIKKAFVSQSIIESIKNEIKNTKVISSKSGIRGADKKFKSIRALANSDPFIQLAHSILGSNPSIVRVIYFDKTPDKNWLVSWHQDKTIALNAKRDIEGWGVWSIKDKFHHVQPPVDVLKQMLTFRLHLDTADTNNGCLKVIPKSHQLGILSQSELNEVANKQKPFECEVEAGDLVMMKPHIIHSSSKSVNPSHRRVIHIEYSNYKLPSDLQWA